MQNAKECELFMSEVWSSKPKFEYWLYEQYENNIRRSLSSIDHKI